MASQMGVSETKTKVTILGAGHVGSHVARALAAGAVAREIVLVDVIPQKARAQAMDVADALSWPPSDVLVRSGGYEDCEDADVTVVAIGKPRLPGQTRLDLLGDSVRMVCELAKTLKAHMPRGLIVSITNPCDIIADCLRKRLGLDRKRVFGTGTLLDTARLTRVLSEQTGAPREQVEAWVLGEHGDSSMIPYSALKIAGKPALDAAGFDAGSALERTHGIGMDIINGKGSTEFGIGQSAAFLIRNILSDTGAVLPLSVELQGEYGTRGIHMGAPCVIGRDGIRQVIELTLTEEERGALNQTIDVLKKHTKMADEIAATL